MILCSVWLVQLGHLLPLPLPTWETPFFQDQPMYPQFEHSS